MKYSLPVTELAMFSIDNNPDCAIGTALDDGAFLLPLPWDHQNDGHMDAIDLCKMTHGVARVIGGTKVGIAALILDEWVRIDPDKLIPDQD